VHGLCNTCHGVIRHADAQGYHRASCVHACLPARHTKPGWFFWTPECFLSGVRLCVEYMRHGAHGVLPHVGEDNYKVPQVASWPVLVCWLLSVLLSPMRVWSRCWAPPEIRCVRCPSSVRLSLRPPAVGVTRLSCVAPAGEGCAPLASFQKIYQCCPSLGLGSLRRQAMLLANLAVQKHEHVCMHKAMCRGFSQATVLLRWLPCPSQQVIATQLVVCAYV